MSFGYDPNWGSPIVPSPLRSTGPYMPSSLVGAAPSFTPVFGQNALAAITEKFYGDDDLQAIFAAEEAKAAAAPKPGSASTGPLSVDDAASFIIQQENGGQPFLPNNLNCDIRPEAGCLDLNTGIFETTAKAWGLDWGRLKAGDPLYGQQAVAQLLTNYANADAGGGMTVWEYGEQNLPGGGWEAVGRYYFGGCVTNGCFVDEQGRSVDTYGQQFVAKLAGAGVQAEQPALSPTPAATAATLPLDPVLADLATTAAETWGVPLGRLEGHIAAEGAPATTPDGGIYSSQDVYGVPAYGPMQIAPTVEGTEYCTAEWCGWGDGTPQTQSTGINHNVYTVDGNVMMGAFILRQAYDHAKTLAPQASEDQLWDMASSFFQTGNYAWDDGSDGSSAAAYKATVDAYAAADAAAAAAGAPGTSGTAGAGVTLPDPSVTTMKPPGTVVTSDPTGQAIADLADDYAGVNYVWGGNPTEGQNPYQTGWDCSGLVSYIADSMGISVRDVPNGIPEGSGAQGDWAEANGRMKPVDQAQPGDVIFFDTRDSGGSNGGVTGRYTHVGIYLGDGMMINAMQECGPGLEPGVNCGTGIVSINSPYWSSHAVGAASMIPTG